MSDKPSMMIREYFSSGHDDEEDNQTKIALDVEIEMLQDMRRDYETKHEFRPGMIVRQKKGITEYKEFSDNGVAIVIRMIDPPLQAEWEPGRPVTGPFDMEIGERIQDGYFMLFRVNSQRYEPVK